MNVEQYEELTGLTVADSQRNRMAAQLDRMQGQLESLLGFTLDPDEVTEAQWVEEGKAQDDWLCSSSTDNLLDPDPVIGAYRAFPYNPVDRIWHLDPFKTIHKVKLARGGVTVRTLDADDFAVMSTRGVTKYLTIKKHHRRRWFWHGLNCQCEKQLQIAVDADWLWTDELPRDLQFVQADMAMFYADAKWQIKSESINGHSYTKAENTPPQELAQNRIIIAKYAGPRGTAGMLPL